MPRLNQSDFVSPVVSVNMVTLEKASILLLVIIGGFRLALSQLVVLSECVCPGRELKLECTVVGGLSTIWMGTAFDCPGQVDVILLRHSQFESGIELKCNNGIIMGRSHNRTFDGPNSKFTSQLIIHLPSLNVTNNVNRLEGRTVQCTHDGVTVIGNHTIAYTRTLNAPPPGNVHLTRVSRTMLTFQWDPVQLVCSDIEYKINAKNCGMCPDMTINTSVICVVSNILNSSNNVCILSVKTTVCGFQSSMSEIVIAVLKAPDRPLISKVLPYYNLSSRQLTKIDFQIELDYNDERFSISDGIDGSITSYTFNISFSDSETNCTSLTAVVPVSSCVAGVCTITLANLTSLPCYKHPSQAEVAVYASNVLTDGPPSTTSLNTSNSLFFVEYEQISNSFSCRFVGRVYENKSCEISYGAIDPINQLCPLEIKVTQHVNSSRISDSVTVFLPELKHAGSELCFLAMGKTVAFTIAVEGTFKTGNQPINEAPQIDAIISGVSISYAVLLTALCATLIVVIVLLVRSRARALKELNLLKENGKRQITAYEEINLTPSAINTSENVAYGHISIK